MRKLVFASHGKLAAGLKDAVQLIVGDLADDIIVYCLQPNQSAEDFAQETVELCNDSQVSEVIALTDLKGASVCNAFTLISSNPKLKVFSGMNLPLALDVLLSYPSPLEDADIKQIIENASQSIENVELKVENESEDF